MFGDNGFKNFGNHRSKCDGAIVADGQKGLFLKMGKPIAFSKEGKIFRSRNRKWTVILG